jgi:hypothetical protein
MYMATVSQQLKGTFTNARKQIQGFEKKAAKQVALFEKKAKASLGEVKEQIDEVPTQLKGAWAEVIGRVRGALDFASHDDLKQLSAKVEDLAKKVEKLVRGDKIKSAAATKSKA